MSMNKKERRAALKSARTSRVEAGKLIVVDELKLPEIKTREFQKVMDALKVRQGSCSPSTALTGTSSFQQGTSRASRRLR